MKRNKLLYCFIIVTLLVVLCGCKSKPQPGNGPFAQINAAEIAKITVSNSDSGHIEEITDKDELAKAVKLFKNAVIEKTEVINGSWGDGPVVTFYDADGNELFESLFIIVHDGGIKITENRVVTYYFCEDTEYFKDFRAKYNLAIYE